MGVWVGITIKREKLAIFVSMTYTITKILI